MNLKKSNFKKKKTSKYFVDVGNILEDGFILINNSGQVLVSNKVSQELLGKNLLNKNILNIIKNPDFNSLNFEKSNKKYDHSFVHELDDYLNRQLRIKLKKISKNKILLTITDLTLQRNLEKIRRDFVANVSHELRSPLTILSGFVETMLNDDKIDKTTLKKFLNIMNEESKRMNTLIDDILSLSKVESEEHILPSTTISIFEPINSVISNIKKSGLLKNNNIILLDDRVDKTQSLIVEADFLELTQVFYNLIENGIKYGNSNSDILIKIDQMKTNELTVSVINEGEGIPEKYIDRVTERFFRVDKARSRKIGGTGLGLAIVKHILIKHRAELSIRSDQNKQTIFSITFPVLKI